MADYFGANAEWVKDYSEEIKDKAIDAISDLQTASMNYFNVIWNNGDGDIDPGFNVSSKVILEWNPPDLGTIPDFNLQAQYSDFSYKTHNNYVWNTTGEAKVYAAIWNIINKQGVGLSQELQDSIFRTDRERKLLALNDALTAINAKTGSKGFRKVNSITGAQQNEVILKYQYDLENQTREITKLMEEHARTNLQFAVQQGIAFENFHADFAMKSDSMFMEMKKTAVQLYVSQVQAEVAVFEATVKSIIQKVEIAKAEVQYFSTVGNVLIEKYKADIQQAAARSSLAFEVGKTNLQSTLTALEGAAKTAQGVMQAVGTSSIEVATKKFS